MKTGKKPAADTEKRSKRKFGLRAKMLLTMLGSLMVVLSITGVILLSQSKAEIVRLTNKDINSQVQSIKLETEAYFNNFFAAMDVFSNSPTVQQAVREAEINGSTYDFRVSPVANQLMQELKEGLQALPEGTKSLFIASVANSQVVKSDGSFTDKSFVVSERAWWKQLVANSGNPIVSSAYEDVSGGTVVTVAVPIRQNNRMVGAVGANISLDHVISLMEQFKVGKTGFAVITDIADNIIYHPDQSIVMKNINETDYEQSIKDIFSNNQDALNCVYQRGANTFHGSTFYIPSVGWQVLGTMPDEEFNAEVGRFRMIVGLCFALTELLLAVIVFINVGTMVRPIKKLDRVASRLSQGELDVEVDTRGNDEIGDLSRSVSKIVDRLKTYIVYIDEVASVLEQIGSRNLVFTLEQDYVGEFQKLKTAMNEVREELSCAMFTIAESTDQVEAGAGNMSGGAQVLAQGATEQASTVQELAATIQELTREAAQESAKAAEASNGATTIGNKVLTSNQQMRELLTAMGKISDQAGEIAKIVKAVEDIAFQTNILALNAAVEAARAGAAGKGFAVVAEEVRNLAGKSSKAAESITEMIQTTIGVVNEGARMADTTAASLDEAARDMGDVVTAIDHIAEKYQEEASQLNEVAVGIDQVSAVVQTNSATAEESAATSEELTAQVATMKALVDSFQLDEQYRQG